MLLSNCTTVDLVEIFPAEAAYSRLLLRATAAAALGKFRAVVEGSRMAIVRAPLATTPAEDRRANIVSMVMEWRFGFENRNRKGRLPTAGQLSCRRSSQAELRVNYLMRKAGEQSDSFRNCRRTRVGTIVSESIPKLVSTSELRELLTFTEVAPEEFNGLVFWISGCDIYFGVLMPEKSKWGSEFGLARNQLHAKFLSSCKSI